jgi:hemerythrin-like metal-binding protein
MATTTPRELIDEAFRDHAEIGQLIERLRTALGAGDHDQVKALLIHLEAIEIRHYAIEDRLMRAVAYDRADAHRAEHTALLDTLARINGTLALENPSAVGPKVVAHLETALAHMIDADEQLSRFVGATAD